MKLKDQRIKVMNEVLNGIKVLKLYAWENAFIDRLNDIREKELRCIRKKAIISTISSVLWTFVPILVKDGTLKDINCLFSFRYALQHLLHMFCHQKAIF